MTQVLDVLRTNLGDRYDFSGELARGGMATVFAAIDRSDGARVAVKVLKRELSTGVGASRFLQEIEIASRLSHPNIIPLRDHGSAAGLLYYVMPLVEGQTLRERLKVERQLPVREAVAIATDVANALEVAHARGLLHRDIKPENILLSENGALLADFGIARALADSGASRLTSTGVVLGTPRYMSPEQAAAEKEIDPRSDVYALACVLYEMLAGEPPFDGPSERVIIAKQLYAEAAPLSVARPETPRGIVRLVTRALAKTPVDRPATAGAFRSELSGGTLEAGADPPTGTSARHRALVATAGAMLLAIGAWAGFALLGRDNPGTQPDANRRSFLVLPVVAGTADSQEVRVSSLAADELTWQINSWEQARGVSQVALTGLAHDLGIEGPPFSNLDRMYDLARSAGAGTLVVLTSRLRGDSVFFETTSFDVESEVQTEDAMVTVAPIEDAFGTLTGVTHRVLGLSGEPEELELLKLESAYPNAISRFREGYRALSRWDLETADRELRAAVDADSTFARAQHYLALALYWATARDSRRLTEVGPEILRRSGAGRRYASGLARKDSMHILAFNAFISGQYERARPMYRELIERDSTDLFAWLQVGALEYHDPALGSSGAERTPVANWNQALRAFEKTVDLAPDFLLGYGHLFDIHRSLARAAHDNVCRGFADPGAGPVRLWESREPPGEGNWFCPVMRDSVVWVPERVFVRSDPTVARLRSDSMTTASVRLVRRFGDYASLSRRPLEEMTDWLLVQRQSIYSPATSQAVQTITEQALAHTEQTLRLSADSTTLDRLRLSQLRLATNQDAQAAATGAAALSEVDRGAEPVPDWVANVAIALGQPEKAWEFLEPVWREVRLAVRDSIAPDSSAIWQFGGVEPKIARLMVYGAAGVSGDVLSRALAELRADLGPDRVGERGSRTLRAYAATEWLVPALLLDEVSLEAWSADLDDSSVVWALYRQSEEDPEAVLAALGEIADADFAEQAIDRPGDLFALAGLAQRLGHDALAVQLFGRFDEYPARVRRFDFAWGLRSRSFIERARAFHRLGDDVSARDYYDRFLAVWQYSEPGVSPLADSAMAERRQLDDPAGP